MPPKNRRLRQIMRCQHLVRIESSQNSQKCQLQPKLSLVISSRHYCRDCFAECIADWSSICCDLAEKVSTQRAKVIRDSDLDALFRRRHKEEISAVRDDHKFPRLQQHRATEAPPPPLPPPLLAPPPVARVTQSPESCHSAPKERKSRIDFNRSSSASELDRKSAKGHSRSKHEGRSKRSKVKQQQKCLKISKRQHPSISKHDSLQSRGKTVHYK